ncbi:NAD(P)-dependent oxidoreductase [Alsobacter metallidurans]|uniref:dTDP-4-dehydrorhamnose reductase n=1 Tax=Alsobacter metallidurans TaxID=340221 RepID=A0A917MGU6_9HYPH|nr:dTDP-4-dehydrorhamnose reductase [Alsobacter metallidurans]GGH17304.1 NAD(P)-dependent oxidoreductase [Alsobacter metallidurans]
MRILILGGAGQVGLELQAYPWPEGVIVDAPSRADLDIADEAAVKRQFANAPYGVVINAAAYTAVDKAESDVVAAWRLNALGPAILAAASGAASIPMVHVSTDYVFDGSAAHPYDTSDPVRPLGVYGASKEGGEQAVRTANPRHAIVRTAWVISPHRANFVKTMLRLAADRPSLRVVDDQWGTPTIASDLAAALARIALRLADDPAAPTGDFHFANEGGVTWRGLASEIMAQSAARGGPSVPVEAITTADFPTPARRPANSRLSTARIGAAFGVTPRPWQDALGDVMDILVGPRRPA